MNVFSRFRLRDGLAFCARPVPALLAAVIFQGCDIPQPQIAPEYQNPQQTATAATAQSIIGIANAARTAGWDFVEKGQGDVRRVVELIVQGHEIDDPASPFNGAVFRVPGLSIAQQEAVAQRLVIEQGRLVLAPLY